MTSELKTHLSKQLAEAQSKYTYFLLAVAASAIALVVQRTTGRPLNWNMIPLGLAVACGPDLSLLVAATEPTSAQRSMRTLHFFKFKMAFIQMFPAILMQLLQPPKVSERPQIIIRQWPTSGGIYSFVFWFWTPHVSWFGTLLR